MHCRAAIYLQSKAATHSRSLQWCKVELASTYGPVLLRHSPTQALTIHCAVYLRRITTIVPNSTTQTHKDNSRYCVTKYRISLVIIDGWQTTPPFNLKHQLAKLYRMHYTLYWASDIVPAESIWKKIYHWLNKHWLSTHACTLELVSRRCWYVISMANRMFTQTNNAKVKLLTYSTNCK